MLKHCKTKYFARMDSDDISLPDRFKFQLNFLEKNNDIDILGTYAIDINEYEEVLRERKVPLYNNQIINTLFYVNPMIHPSVIFKVKSILKIGGYNEKYRTSQDYYLWFLSASKNLKFANLNLFLLKYRMDSSYSNRKNLKYRINDIRIKFNGFKLNKVPYYKYMLLLIPILVWLIPIKYISKIKKLDPREKYK